MKQSFNQINQSINKSSKLIKQSIQSIDQINQANKSTTKLINTPPD
jgi:hypothetical protein